MIRRGDTGKAGSCPEMTRPVERLPASGRFRPSRTGLYCSHANGVIGLSATLRGNKAIDARPVCELLPSVHNEAVPTGYTLDPGERVTVFFEQDGEDIETVVIETSEPPEPGRHAVAIFLTTVENRAIDTGGRTLGQIFATSR